MTLTIAAMICFAIAVLEPHIGPMPEIPQAAVKSASTGAEQAPRPATHADAPPDAVREDESRRIAIIKRISPTVVCIHDDAQHASGSGVIIDPDGYGLTNFHVVDGLMPNRTGLGGLNDGQLYPLEVLGVDPIGDVAMFRLTGRPTFEFSDMGDSDAVRLGDFVLAMGNPFSLSEDFSPTVTQGIVTGVHRYQWGVEGRLVYSDCIQTDASINPGNSGGPLFNAVGEVIGINGRISVNTRGRYNVGFGYAISADQIARFIPTLRAGLVATHGTLQATVRDEPDAGVIFGDVMRDAPAWESGVRPGDELLAFDGRPIESRNRFASLMGTYPGDWPVTITIRKNGAVQVLTARLEPVPPKLGQPFPVNTDANARAVQRVLVRHRRSVLGGDDREPPRAAAWKVVRTFPSGENGPARREEQYDGAWSQGQPIRITAIGPAESAWRTIEYDANNATERAAKHRPIEKSSAPDAAAPAPAGESADAKPTTDPIALPHDLALALRALYVAQIELGRPLDSAKWTGVQHLGGNLLLVTEADGVDPQCRVVEVLHWPLDDHTVVQFSFDVEAYYLRRILIRDSVLETKVVVLLDGHRAFGETIWPTSIEVHLDGLHVHDAISDVTLQP